MERHLAGRLIIMMFISCLLNDNRNSAAEKENANNNQYNCGDWERSCIEAHVLRKAAHQNCNSELRVDVTGSCVDPAHVKVLSFRCWEHHVKLVIVLLSNQLPVSIKLVTLMMSLARFVSIVVVHQDHLIFYSCFF